MRPILDTLDYDPHKHNYWRPLQKFIRKHKLIGVSRSMVDICHDDRCAIWHGNYCNCVAVIRLSQTHARL
jgi:hypothetical protein